MKKILLVLCCVFLCACSNQDENQKGKDSKKKKEDISNEQLTMKEWRYLFWRGDGNEDGYYRIKEQELDNGKTTMNLRYFDYQTKQEIFLCDKPECLHDDETCTSYLPSSAIGAMLFVYQDHLYLSASGGASSDSLGQLTSKGAILYQMDLDGKNKKEIWQLDESEEFDNETIVVGNNSIYIPIVKNEIVTTGGNSSMNVTREKKLMALDLKTEKTKEILDLKDKAVIGVYNQDLVIRQAHYSDDPNKYLENKDYSGYDNVIINAKMGYFKYNLDTKKQSAEVLPDDSNKEFGDYYQNKIYSINQGKVYELDLDSGIQNEILALDNNSSYSLINFVDNHLIIDVWRKDEYTNSLVVSLDGLEIKELNLHKKDPKEAIDILNITNDYLFVRYDHDGQYKKTWAGTDQYEVSKEYFGLISKGDFFNSLPNYQTLKELG